jgi:FixJ family two-component response regulator
MPVLFLTGHADIPASVRAMRRGAVDFLEKRAPREELLHSVRAALERGEREFEKRLRLRELDKRFARLTPREKEVLQHVVVGRMNKEIAAALSINERTVKLHRTAITRKVGVHSSAQLATLSTEIGLFGRETV